LLQLIQDWHEKKWFDNISIVSSDEKKILRLIRDKSTRELTIIKNKDNPERVIQIKDNSINLSSINI